ncbi:sulfite oxidase-like oxidoreductase [Paenibacillus sp. JX-17]|uniref:Sulfite oxidase-like oxidoreductase n=1 Tax=Paenibacillus lacisoli TaxID=3064525 RepID=A0ABT9CC03_9BACL|nr:sulfite oxidase-like oxidoreductase [Paenibacillus sp. JX-17]MDO7906795.1 sulfite oxidase-like oxidoreductase [Paenibacillus sp. JX-17]
MEDKAKRLKAASRRIGPSAHEEGDRLPPGQSLTDRFPILHIGEVPRYELDTWTLRVFGEVEEEQTFTYADLLQLPRVQSVSDIHCVTRWSKFDTVWEGVRFRDLLAAVSPKKDAGYVMIHADPDYETNLPLTELMGDDVLLAYHYDGKPLTPKHGWPIRLVVPQLYFWKSAKWIRGIEFMKEDRQGFWENHGFHNEADPFKEERFSEEEYEMPEDEWKYCDYD